MDIKNQFKNFLKESVSLTETPRLADIQALKAYRTTSSSARAKQYNEIPTDQLADKKAEMNYFIQTEVRSLEDKIDTTKQKNKELAEKINSYLLDGIPQKDKKDNIKLELYQIEYLNKYYRREIPEDYVPIEKPKRFFYLYKINSKLDSLQTIFSGDKIKIIQKISSISDTILFNCKQINKFKVEIQKILKPYEDYIANYNSISDRDYKAIRNSNIEINKMNYDITDLKKEINKLKDDLVYFRDLTLNNENIGDDYLQQTLKDINNRQKKLSNELNKAKDQNEHKAIEISLEILNDAKIEIEKEIQNYDDFENKEDKINSINSIIQNLENKIDTISNQILDTILTKYESLINTIKHYYGENNINNIVIKDYKNSTVRFNIPHLNIDETYTEKELDKLETLYTIKGKIYSALNILAFKSTVLPKLQSIFPGYTIESIDTSNIGKVGEIFDEFSIKLTKSNDPEERKFITVTHGLTKVLNSADWKEEIPQLDTEKQKEREKRSQQQDDDQKQQYTRYEKPKTDEELNENKFNELIKWFEDRGLEIKRDDKNLSAKVYIESLTYKTFYPAPSKKRLDKHPVFNIRVSNKSKKCVFDIDFSAIKEYINPSLHNEFMSYDKEGKPKGTVRVSIHPDDSEYQNKYLLALNQVCDNIKLAYINSINLSKVIEYAESIGLKIDPEMKVRLNVIMDYTGVIKFIDSNNQQYTITLNSDKECTEEEIKSMFNNAELQNKNVLFNFVKEMEKNNLGKLCYILAITKNNRLFSSNNIDNVHNYELTSADLAFQFDGDFNIFKNSSETFEPIIEDSYQIRFTPAEDHDTKLLNRSIPDLNGYNLIKVFLDLSKNPNIDEIFQQIKTRAESNKESTQTEMTEEVYLINDEIKVEFNFEDCFVDDDHNILINSAKIKMFDEDDGQVISSPGQFHLNIDEIREDILKNYNEDEYNFDSLLLDLSEVQKDKDDNQFFTTILEYNPDYKLNIEHGSFSIPYSIQNKKEKKNETGQATTNDFEFIESEEFKNTLLKFIESLEFIQGK